MTHSGSRLTFKINDKKGLIEWKQKESYTKNDGDKAHEEFSGEFDLGRTNEEIFEYVEGVAKSWARGDSIKPEARADYDGDDQ